MRRKLPVMSARYDTIGRGYSDRRRADPRIASMIDAALAGASRIVNVGAGTGSYEPPGRVLAALDPSSVMLAQRPAGRAPAVRGVAEALPFPDGAFDAGLAVLTIHHWSDWRTGLAEVRRVAGRVVVLTVDEARLARSWLVTDYLPEVTALDPVACPPVDAVTAALGSATVTPVPVPADCTDGFFEAYWARPEAYLDPSVRAAISTFAFLDPGVLTRALDRLRADLASGAWDDRHGALRHLDALDLGYRLVVGPP